MRPERQTSVTVDDTDQLQGRPDSQSLIADLRAVVHTVVPVNVMHQKIAVIDERTVMIGSLSTLSQSWTREVMVTMRCGHFARKLLEPLVPQVVFGHVCFQEVVRPAADVEQPGERLVMPRPVIRRLLMITARVEFPASRP
ncbi:hypothetical protein [Streptomyces sp. LN704]|uniref:hypothetical protein n=1 Tax=unclassified Streptomyces TaxID=2593676 RepID=UPI0037226FE2